MGLVKYGCNVKPETKDLTKNLVAVLKSSAPYPSQTVPITSQRELLEDMLKVYEIAHPGIFQAARALEVVYSSEIAQEYGRNVKT